MLSVYRTLSLRYLARRWVRALLIVASIALGVATLVATRALNETMNKAGLASVNPMPGVADFVVSNGELTIARDLAKSFALIPGVQEAWPRIFENVKLPDLDNRPVLILGIDKNEAQKNKGLDINLVLDEDIKGIANSLPKAMDQFIERLGPSPVVVGKELGKELDQAPKKGWDFSFLLSKNVNKTLEKFLARLLIVQTNVQGSKAYLIRVGTVEAKGVAAALAGNILILDLADAAKVLGLGAGRVNRIDVTLKPGVNKAKVREEVEKVAKGHGVVRTPEEQNHAMGNVMSGMQTGFSLCGLAALVVGLFLVYNALAVCVAERRHEIGVLISLGATRGQIRWLFAGEAALLGLAGSLLGIPLGIGLSYLGLQPVQEIMRDIFFNVEANQVEIGPDLLLLAMAAGMVTAVVAALVPAFAASRENPAEAVRRVAKAPTWGYLAWQVASSFILLGLGTAFILLRHHMVFRLGTYGGMVMVLLGALMAAPLLTAVVARLIQPFAQRWWPLHWRLAADNLVRAPGRTGLVIAALAAGVALVTQTFGTIISNRTALREWVQESIAADLIVTSGSPVGAGGGQTQIMKETLGKQIGQVPGIEAALPMRFRRVPYRDTQVLLFAADASSTYEIEKKRLTNTPALELNKTLGETPRTAIVSENFAALHGVGKGDTIVLSAEGKEVNLLVIGKVVDYSWNHGTIFIDRKEYKELWKDSDVEVYDVYVKTSDDPTSAAYVQKVKEIREKLLTKLGAENGLVVMTRKELQAQIDDVIERIYLIALGQQLVVMVVAALGVVMALLISVLQRRREMGLLRAIGASRSQVVRSVLAEAFLMGVIGTFIGFLVGVPLEWYVLKVLILEESGYLFAVYVPWLEGLAILAVGLAIPMLAGLVPAIMSVRQQIPEAIAYE